MTRRTFVAATASAAAAGAARAAPVGIDEGMFVELDGHEHWITIRGQDLSNPVLLMLHGGPGIPMTFMAPAFAEWEKRFTLVVWDQPGGGATYLKNAARGQGPMTIARFVDDGLAVAEWARTRLKAGKLVLLGNSWGTMLGVMMIQRRPDLFSAYVGTSQAVGPEGALLGYQLGLQAARDRGDAAAVAALEKVGPPPYATFEDLLVRQQYTNPPGLPPTPAEAAAGAAQARILSAPPPPGARYTSPDLGPYDFVQVFYAAQRATFAEAWAWKARDHGLTFKVPVFVFQGDHDLNTPLAPARAWFDQIEAPNKAFEVLPGAGHNTIAFTDQLLALLEKHVRPLALRSAL